MENASFKLKCATVENFNKFEGFLQFLMIYKLKKIIKTNRKATKHYT